MELQTVGMEHAFSCFMPVNLDCPMDGRENVFAYGSGSGVPYPWQEVSMTELAGDLWILSGYVIHRGGAVPRDAPPGSTRIIAFAAIATRRVDYATTVPIVPPPCAEAPPQQPLPPSPKVLHCTAAQCNRVVKADPPAKCSPVPNVPFVLYMSGNSVKTISGILGILLWRPPLNLLWRPPLDMLWRLWRCQPREQRKSMRTCGFAALVLMPLDQTVLYTTHRHGPLATKSSSRQ